MGRYFLLMDNSLDVFCPLIQSDSYSATQVVYLLYQPCIYGQDHCQHQRIPHQSGGGRSDQSGGACLNTLNCFLFVKSFRINYS